jgi:hypothetical protein
MEKRKILIMLILMLLYCKFNKQVKEYMFGDLFNSGKALLNSSVGSILLSSVKLDPNTILNTCMGCRDNNKNKCDFSNLELSKINDKSYIGKKIAQAVLKLECGKCVIQTFGENLNIGNITNKCFSNLVR